MALTCVRTEKAPSYLRCITRMFYSAHNETIISGRKNKDWQRKKEGQNMSGILQ